MSPTEKPVFIQVESDLLDSQGKLINPLEIGNCLSELSFIEATAIQLLSKNPNHLKIYVAIKESNQGGKRFVGRSIHKRIERFNYNGFIEILGLPMFPSTVDSSIDWSSLSELQSYRLSNEPICQGSNETQNAILKCWSKYLNIPIDCIDLDDNLFTLGGNLFLIGRIAHQLYQLSYPVTIETIIDNPTVRSLASKIDSLNKAGVDDELLEPIPKSTSSNDERKSLLSWTQRWVFIHEQFLGKGNFYYLDVSYKINQGLTYQLIESALNQLVSLISLLRSFVRVRGSSYYLNIAPTRKLSIPIIKVSNDEEARMKIDERKNNFNVVVSDDSFLFDVVFIETPEVSCYTLFIHHLIVDDLSYLLLEEHLLHLLQSQVQSELAKSSSHQMENIDYIDYSVWVTQFFQRKLEIIDPLENYWLDRMKDLPNCLIPVNYDENNPPKEPKVSGKHALISLTVEETNGARSLVRSVGTTFEILAEALIKVVLYKLTGVGDTIIKRMISARLHPMAYQMIGHFNNMIYSRTAINGNSTFTSVLKDFHSSWQADFKCRGYPWINLIAQTNVEHVCPAGISIIGLPEERFVDDDQLSVKTFNVDQFTQVSFELITCIYGFHEGKLHYCLNYNEDLLPPEVIQVLINAFEVLVKRVVTYSDRPIWDYFKIEPAVQFDQWPQQVNQSE
uniref:Carrier domain-containing protein n=1 Tax=Tetranychus urticae TaxID=32264 RepID=T1KX99_TETUR